MNCDVADVKGVDIFIILLTFNNEKFIYKFTLLFKIWTDESAKNVPSILLLKNQNYTEQLNLTDLIHTKRQV